MSNFKGKMYPVSNSSQILAAGGMYDESGENVVMRIEFVRGGLYEYNVIPKSVYDGFWKSPKKGSYFHSNIKKAKGVEFKKIR